MTDTDTEDSGGYPDLDIDMDALHAETHNIAAVGDKNRFAVLVYTAGVEGTVPHDHLLWVSPEDGEKFRSDIGRLLEAGLMQRAEAPAGATGLYYEVTDQGADLVDTLLQYHRTAAEEAESE